MWRLGYLEHLLPNGINQPVPRGTWNRRNDNGIELLFLNQSDGTSEIRGPYSSAGDGSKSPRNGSGVIEVGVQH
jgi:hypothetical protein